ncbi:MAG: DUF6861 domain-containing protein [Telluria sp.]
MGYGTTDTWRVWSDLRRKEDDLKWCGHRPGSEQHYDSMGRAAHAASHLCGWGNEQMGRVDRVRQALAESGPSAQHMIARRLSGINLSTIWHILISVCEDIALYYGGSVVAGGLIGGFGGAFLGGVGAVPGAAAGAAVGSYVGGAVLSMLGLKSLVLGVVQSVPEALDYYKKGFLEAWGPTRQDRLQGFGMTARGSPSSAAFYLAHGHVIMVTTILAVLLAYVTRGKGDKAALLKEIEQSPRLGPKVAKWVEQNEEKLRHHPALQWRGSGGAGALPREEPPLPSRRARREPERSRPSGMPKKTVPCFKTKSLPQGSVPEFDRQLTGQETGINNMTVDEYLNGREAFESEKSTRSSSIARNARASYEGKMTFAVAKKLQEEGLSLIEADKKAEQIAAEKMKTLAALHIPDMIAGGKDVIGDFGDRNINSRIGAQWNKGGRLAELDKAANALPQAIRAITKMNVKLERCK